MANNNFQLIPSNKGGHNKLAYEGHIYNYHRTSDMGIRFYRCFNYHKVNCKGWATLYNNGVTIKQEHTFPCIPAPADIRVHNFNANLRASALANHQTTPRNLVNEALQNLDPITTNRLISLENLGKRVNRVKQKHNNNERIPHVRQQIDFPNELRITKTLPPENFILHDTGPQDPERIIVFGSDTDVKRLVSSQTWLVDGTFDVIFLEFKIFYPNFYQKSLFSI